MDPISLALMAGQVGSSLLGGYMGSKGAGDSQAAMAAAIAQAQKLRDKGYKNALGSYKTGYTDASGHIGGGYDAAINALGPARHDATDQIYGDLGAGEGGFDTYQAGLRNSFEASPGYQFRMDEGQKALTNNMNARGMTRSGSYDKALTDYSQGRASDEFARHTGSYQDYLSRMMGLAGREDQNAAQRGQLQVGKGTGLGALDWDYGQLKGGTQIERAGANAEAAYGQGMNQANGITGKTNAWTNALGNVGQAFGSFAGNAQGMQKPGASTNWWGRLIMAFNALRYSYLPREPDKFDVGPMIDRFRQGEADGNARRVRNALGTAGSMAAGGDMTGASNELLGQGELDAGFGIQDRQRAVGERAQKAKLDAINQQWQQQERARQQTNWGRQDQEWNQGQAAAGEARKAKAAGLYANLYRMAGGDQAKLKQLEDVARAGGFEIPAEFSQPGGGEVAQAIAGGGQEPMTQYQQQQIEIEKQKLAREHGIDLTAVDKKAIIEADELAQSSAAAMQGLDRALQLHKKAYSGFMANERGALMGALGGEAGSATQELNNVITGQALESLKAIFGGMPTEGERQILMQIQGSAEQPAAVRKAILQRARAAAETRMNFNQQRSQQLRSGAYYQANRPDAGAGAFDTIEEALQTAPPGSIIRDTQTGKTYRMGAQGLEEVQ